MVDAAEDLDCKVSDDCGFDCDVLGDEDLDCKASDDCGFDCDVLGDDEARVYHAKGMVA